MSTGPLFSVAAYYFLGLAGFLDLAGFLGFSGFLAIGVTSVLCWYDTATSFCRGRHMLAILPSYFIRVSSENGKDSVSVA